jgi:hypothetical protein
VETPSFVLSWRRTVCFVAFTGISAAVLTPTAAVAKAPRVTHFAFKPKTFVAAPAGTRATSVTFRLSRRADVRISIARLRPGRRPLTIGRIERRRRAGRSVVSFSGTLNGRRLRAAAYRATLVATDAQRRRSASRSTTFTVVAIKPEDGAAQGSPTGDGGSSPQSPPAVPSFPSPATTGVPAGWSPRATRAADLHVREAGAVIEDLQLVNASIIVEAPNVTIRRVRLQGGKITNFRGAPCQSGMVIEDTTIEPAPGEDSSIETEGVVEVAGYTARRVKIWRRSEGFRAMEDCGPVRIEDSFAKIVIPDGRCDLHSDGIQGYGAPWTTVVNTTIDFVEAECGTAPFFMPKNQGNTGATIDRLLVMGGGYPFRLGVPGTVSGLRIVDRSWVFGPIDVACSRLSQWDAAIVTIDADYQVTGTVRRQPCNTETGN